MLSFELCVYICNSVVFVIEPKKKHTKSEGGRENERLTQWVQSSQATKSIKRHKRFLLVAYMQSHSVFSFIEVRIEALYTQANTHTWHHLSFPFIYYLLKCSNVSLRFFYSFVWFWYVLIQANGKFVSFEWCIRYYNFNSLYMHRFHITVCNMATFFYLYIPLRGFFSF